MNLIKPEMSNLRQAIRAAIGVTKRRADPLPYKNDAWRAEIEIGFAVQEDRVQIGGEHRLRFKRREELADVESADR